MTTRPPLFPVRRSENRKPHPPAAELGFGKHFTDHMFLSRYTPEQRWHDSAVVPYGPLTLDPAAAVFHYGQALFEGLKAFRADDGKVNLFRVERHAQRLVTGAQRLCMPVVDRDLMVGGLLSLVGTDHDWVPRSPGTALYLRPTLVATEPFLGVRSSANFDFFIIASPVGSYYGSAGLAPVRIWVEEKYVRAARGGLGAVKAGANYAASLLAAEEAKRRGYAQVLWLDASQHRQIEEVGTMNIFLRIGDTLVTPPLGGTILAGVTRESVITLAREWGLDVEEREIGMDEVVGAHVRGSLKEMFGCGTAAVISPIGELGYGGERLMINGGRAGDLAQRLYDTITGIQYGRLPDKYGWLTEVPAP